MKHGLYKTILIFFILGFLVTGLYAQMDDLYGDDGEYRMGMHSGNLFRITFFNDGTWGGHPSRPGEIGGEWPINSGHIYLMDGNIFVGSEVIDNSGQLQHIVITVKSANIQQSTGDTDPISGAWWTFLPLAGFANPVEENIAMAKGKKEWENSWPSYWPDKFDDPSDSGWRNDGVDGDDTKAAWNGYFGKNVFNADEESYFVSDDYANQEFPTFRPDSTDPTRGGLGIRMYTRGFQWSKTAVEDALFCLFDFENIGTHLHDKVVFGYKVGNNMGDLITGVYDTGDDDGAYNKDEDIAYLFDNDDIGATGWGPDPVGYFGGAFLESPGNPYDGIDNDNDGLDYAGPTITESLFAPRTLVSGDEIVVINYTTFSRRLTTLADTLASLGTDTLEVYYQDLVFKFYDGKELTEIPDDLVDNNLNGLIDENRGAEDELGIFQYLYIDNGTGYKCIDYFNTDIASNGMDNPMLDERRDDGVDNDGDWNALFDDVGADGLAPGDSGYPGPDPGEGDGVPTSGEPHFDKVDIDETDMLGLTSFNLYYWPDIPHYDDEAVWAGIRPGLFIYGADPSNLELLYGSGYFPLPPGQIERFSMGLICGIDLEDLLRNKDNVEEAYNQNYNFAQAPYIPTIVKTIAGDNRVTLFWDDFAESSVDPISGEDFEGYRIYRSTDPGWNDMSPITDGYGTSYVTPLWRKPLVQFDLDNDFSGFAAFPTEGVHFWLGENTGIRHSWIDTTAVNGFTYYYAVTSFDHGDPEKGIDPSECSKFIAVAASGDIDKGTNVTIVRPEAPAAGYVAADFESGQIMPGADNTADGYVDYAIIDPELIKDNHTYRITFEDTLSTTNLDSTQSFTLVDVTSNETLLSNASLEEDAIPIIDGFQLTFRDNSGMLDYIPDSSGWSRSGIYAYSFLRFSYQSQPVDLIVGDFDIIFSDVGVDTSSEYYRGNNPLPSIPVNFIVLNTLTNKNEKFAFRERHAEDGEEGMFTFDFARRRSDEIIILTDSSIASWRITMTADNLADTLLPGPGDVLEIKVAKPFLAHDMFEFTTNAAGVDENLAKVQIEDIKVVPNPYVVANSWEPENPYSDGRGDRQLHFIHLPQRCTITIFNIRGQLVDTIEHDAPVSDGTEVWDMLSKDNLDISYGVYIYHVSAENVGEKIGKFVVIK